MKIKTGMVPESYRRSFLSMLPHPPPLEKEASESDRSRLVKLARATLPYPANVTDDGILNSLRLTYRRMGGSTRGGNHARQSRRASFARSR